MTHRGLIKLNLGTQSTSCSYNRIWAQWALIETAKEALWEAKAIGTSNLEQMEERLCRRSREPLPKTLWKTGSEESKT